MKPDNSSDCVVQIETPNKQTVKTEIMFLNTIIYSDQLVSHTQEISLDYLFPWLFNSFNSIYSLPLSTKINVKLTGDPSFQEPVINVIKALFQILAFTRQKIEANLSLASETNNFKGKLFLNLGETPFLNNLYQESLSRDPDHTHYDPCHFLNDYYNKQPTQLPSFEELILVIREKQIKYIYTHNTSYIRYFIEYHKVFLPTLLERLGVELVIVDFDTYNQMDGFYYLKQCLNNSHFRRYCIMPHIESYWDKKLELRNIHYFPTPFKVDDNNEKLNILDNDFKIIITTWARLPQIIHYMKLIVFFLQYVDFSRPILNYQILFHSLTEMLLKDTTISTQSKMRQYFLLSEMYYQTNSILKFEIIDQIKTNREICLYGEDDWGLFFPQYYKGLSDQNKLKEILSQNSYLQILMNSNYSYYENNPMFLKLLNANNPYLGFCSVITDDDLQGLRLLEYSNIDELNSKIENINTLSHAAEFQSSKKILGKKINNSIDDFYDHLLNSNNPERKDLLFERIVDEKRLNSEKTILEFIKNNQSRLEECLDRIKSEDFNNLNPEYSPLMNRPYFQKLMSIYCSKAA